MKNRSEADRRWKRWLCAALIGSAVTSTAMAASDTRPSLETFYVQEGTMIGATVSPDRQSIVIDLQGTLYRLPIGGGAATAITDVYFDAHKTAWSPDGSRIAFQSNRDGIWHLWTIAPDGSNAEQLTTGLSENREPAYSPDGRHIAFSSNRDGQYEIWTIDLKTRQQRKITDNPENDFEPTWSADGRRIFFVSDRKAAPGIYSISSDGSNERRVHEAAGALISAPSPSPNGAHLAYIVVAKGKATLMVDGDAVSDQEDAFAFRPQWISDSEFLYTADGKIKRHILGQSNSEIIPFSAALQVRPKTDTPAYTPRPANIAGSESQKLLGVLRPNLAPDGRQIAFVALGDLWLMPIGSSPLKLTDDAAEEQDPSWSPDGRFLAYSSDRSGAPNIFIRDLGTGTERQLTAGKVTETRPVWSHDGKHIAYMVQPGFYRTELHVIDVATGKDRLIQPVTFGSGYPSWSPDDAILMTSELLPTSTRYRQGATAIRLTHIASGESRFVVPVPGNSIGKRTGDGPIWSPDGKRIAFTMADMLWVLDVTPEGEPIGEPRKINDDAAEFLSWSGDSRTLLYLDQDRLKTVDVDGGPLVTVPVPLTWTRQKGEGRFVIHAGRLITGVADGAQTDMDVVIEDNRILKAVPHDNRLHAGRVIDASRQTVMAGLFEAHAHEMRDLGDKLGRSLLAYGITSKRSTSNSPIEMVEEREAWESGRRFGPRLFGTGYEVDGRYTYYETAVPVTNEKELSAELDRAKRLDYALLKTYVNLGEGLREKAIAAAHALGIPATSHEIYPAAQFGQDAVEHMMGTASRGFSTKVSTLGKAYDDVIQILARSGMSIAPTAVLPGYDTLPRLQTDMEDVRWQRLQPEPVRRREASKLPAMRGDPVMAATITRNFGLSMVAMQRAGVNLMVGTDSPVVPFGLALHKELELMVAAGLTPMEVIRAATINTAKALHIDKELGTIEAGKLADLIVVDGDPLTDIRAARAVTTVIKNGVVIPVTEIIGQSQ